MSRLQTILGLLKPNYSELSLFLMGVSIVALYLIDPELREQCQWLTAPQNMDARTPVVLVIFGQGMIFSIIHLFTNSEKNSYEKVCMLFFALLLNALASISIITELVDGGRFGWVMIFPIWNLLNCAIFLMILSHVIRSGHGFEYMEDFISDDETNFAHAIIGLVVVTICITVGSSILQLHWAIVFSICIAYASNADHLLKALAHKHISADGP